MRGSPVLNCQVRKGEACSPDLIFQDKKGAAFQLLPARIERAGLSTYYQNRRWSNTAPLPARKGRAGHSSF